MNISPNQQISEIQSLRRNLKRRISYFNTSSQDWDSSSSVNPLQGTQTCKIRRLQSGEKKLIPILIEQNINTSQLFGDQNNQNQKLYISQKQISEKKTCRVRTWLDIQDIHEINSYKNKQKLQTLQYFQYLEKFGKAQQKMISENFNCKKNSRKEDMNNLLNTEINLSEQSSVMFQSQYSCNRKSKIIPRNLQLIKENQLKLIPLTEQIKPEELKVEPESVDFYQDQNIYNPKNQISLMEVSSGNQIYQTQSQQIQQQQQKQQQQQQSECTLQSDKKAVGQIKNVCKNYIRGLIHFMSNKNGINGQVREDLMKRDIKYYHFKEYFEKMQKAPNLKTLKKCFTQEQDFKQYKSSAYNKYLRIYFFKFLKEQAVSYFYNNKKILRPSEMFQQRRKMLNFVMDPDNFTFLSGRKIQNVQ